MQNPLPDILVDTTPPAQLSEEAAEQWREIAPTLSTDKLLTGLDRRELMIYCEEMAKYWKYQKKMAAPDFEDVIELHNKDGDIVNAMKNPIIDFSNQALTNAHKIGLHFGLTPLSRTKIGMPSKKESSPEENNLNKLNALRGKSGKIVPMQKSAS